MLLTKTNTSCCFHWLWVFVLIPEDIVYIRFFHQSYGFYVRRESDKHSIDDFVYRTKHKTYSMEGFPFGKRDQPRNNARFSFSLFLSRWVLVKKERSKSQGEREREEEEISRYARRRLKIKSYIALQVCLREIGQVPLRRSEDVPIGLLVNLEFLWKWRHDEVYESRLRARWSVRKWRKERERKREERNLTEIAAVKCCWVQSKNDDHPRRPRVLRD